MCLRSTRAIRVDRSMILPLFPAQRRGCLPALRVTARIVLLTMPSPFLRGKVARLLQGSQKVSKNFLGRGAAGATGEAASAARRLPWRLAGDEDEGCTDLILFALIKIRIISPHQALRARSLRGKPCLQTLTKQLLYQQLSVCFTHTTRIALLSMPSPFLRGKPCLYPDHCFYSHSCTAAPNTKKPCIDIPFSLFLSPPAADRRGW